jgi:hypothetical protein
MEKLVFGRQSVAPRSRDPHLCDLDDRSRAFSYVAAPRKRRLSPKARRALVVRRQAIRPSGVSERYCWCCGTGLIRSLAGIEAADQKQGDGGKHAQFHSVAHDTPTGANVRIGAAQASTGKALIGPFSEETPHRCQMIPSFRIVRQKRDFASNSLTRIRTSICREPGSDRGGNESLAGPAQHRLAGESEQSRADKGAIAPRSVMAQETCCTGRNARRKFDSRERFPRISYLDGPLMTETMAQAAGSLMLGLLRFSSMPFLAGVEGAKFRSFVSYSSATNIASEQIPVPVLGHPFGARQALSAGN